MIIAVFLAWVSMVLSVPAGAAGEPIGFVRNTEGPATVVRGGETLPAVAGTKLLVGDTLSTGPGGQLGAVFRDNSSISLGPESSLAVRNFEFTPEKGKIGLLIRISRGTMAYLSGLIGKLAPETARFETPVASIGIRGTHFAIKIGKDAPK